MHGSSLCINTYTVSFFGHRAIEDPLLIEQRLEILIRKLLEEKEYYAIDRDSIQGHLCQSCLDSINEMWFADDPPAEYGVLSFADRTIRPLITCTTGFGMGNFHVDCDFEDDGKIDLLIFYCPPRYK